MNPNELAAKMLLWAAKRAELDVLEAEIAGAVLAIGQTKTTGDVVASYSKGRAEYDYQTPAEAAFHAEPERWTDVIAKYTSTEPVIDWAKICKYMDLKPLEIKRSAPSVTVKLKTGKESK